MTPVIAKTSHAKPHAAKGLKILVAEDSPITHELLKLLLQQRGHDVDIATDGKQALQALRTNDYDVVLLDFHLPEMSGLQVATALRKEAAGRKLPRLIVITADVEGLLSHGEECESFDHIIPKPLDIYKVGELIEEQADLACEQTPAIAGAPVQRPALAPEPPQRPTTFLDELSYEYLSWPDDLQSERLSARGLQATLGDPRFAAIVIREHIPDHELGTICRRKSLFALPVIDLTGELGAKADLDASAMRAKDAERVRELINRFKIERARLNRDLLLSDEFREQLLGRVFVSHKLLTAAFDPGSKTLVSYNTVFSSADVAREAELLASQGLLKREFFDRFHICPRCDSARMHVHEECPQCHSASLREEAYLHHFKCAYQGLESEFRSGDDLICPKCRGELSHFGFDYDRPGTMIVCNRCGHAGADPSVGFVCLDCGAHATSESCPTRDIYSYRITDQGTGFAEFGRSFLTTAGEVFRFADLPLELVVALNADAKRYNEEKVPFTLVSIAYDNERKITVEDGALQFDQARNLFLENLRSDLQQSDLVVKGKSYDLALLRGIDPNEARSNFDSLRNSAQRSLRLDLGARLQAFGPEDIS